MQKNKKTSSFQPTVLVQSNCSSLSLNFVREVLKKSCRVIVASKNNSGWKKNTVEKNIHLVNLAEIENENFQYLLYINEFDLFRKTNQEVDQIIKIIKDSTKIVNKVGAKSLFVFPYTQTRYFKKKISLLKKQILSQKEFVSGIIYLGQVIDLSYEHKEKNMLTELVKDAAFRGEISVPKNYKSYYPVKADIVARQIVKNLFSFGVYGSQAAIISDRVTQKDLVERLKNTSPNLVIHYHRNFNDPVYAKYERLIKTKADLNGFIINIFSQATKKKKKVGKNKDAKTIESLKKHKRIAKRTQEKPQIKKPKRKFKKSFVKIFFLTALLLLSPLILILMSLSTQVAAKEFFYQGSLKAANALLSFSEYSSKTATTQLQYYSKLPVLDKSLKNIDNLANLFLKTAKIENHKISLVKQTKELFHKITGSVAYDLSNYSKNIAVELDYLYKELGFLQGELQSLDSLFKKRVFLGEYSNSQLARLREKIYFVSKIVADLPILLGQEKPATYLILIQDNTKLRPTGGLIQSYVLLTFDAGKLTKKRAFNANDIDKEIKGSIEPPYLINKYLQQTSWLFKDSNWDPDFKVSAQKAGWFINKATGENIDGVAGVDLSFIEQTLELFGPIYLEDIDREINHNNFAELLAGSEEGDLLALLADKLLNRIMELDNRQLIKLALIVDQNLEEKHLLLDLRSAIAQKAASSLNWSGELPALTCEDNCLSDWLGIVEANVGKNNINNFIKRSGDLTIDIKNDTLSKKLLIKIENTKLQTASQENNYQAYIRILVPIDSVFQPVGVLDTQHSQLIEPQIAELFEHKEAGFFVEVPASQEKTIRVAWKLFSELDLSKNGEYLFYWRKQPGTLNDPVVLKYNFPGDLIFQSQPRFSLTGTKAYGYNTSLSRDFVSRIYW